VFHHYVPQVPLNVSRRASRPPSLRVRKRPMDSLNFTFEKLKNFMSARLRAGTTLSEASGPNLLSALTGFMSERGYSEQEVIGSILRASYRRNLQAHVETLKAKNRTSAYIANRKFLLGHWRRALIEADLASAAQAGGSSPFQTALNELFSQGATRKGTCRATGLPLPTLKRWLSGAIPNARSSTWVPRLENHFALPPGTLADLLPYRLGNNQPPTPPVVSIAYRERLKAQHKSPYALKNASDRLRNEWMSFVAYKVEAGSGGRGRLRRAKSGMWAKTAQPVRPKLESNWFAFQRHYYVATADAKWSLVSQYIGWLMLDVARGGMGMPGEQAMTLANFARDDLLRGYQEWRIERSGGTSHQGILTILWFVAGLCHPETGYLTQSWDQFQGLSRASTIEEWLQDCQYAYEYVKNLGNDLGALGGKSRNSFDPIRVALDLPNPLDAVADAVLRMDANRPSTGGVDEAIWARDRLLVKLLASNPLRDKNARMLTYRANGSGHLRKKDGVWRVAIPKNEFKNFKGAAKERDYDMPVRPEVWPDIERYLRDYRPMLVAGDTPYVFVSSERGDRPWYRLRRQFEALTRKYLAGCPGVGPHAMRHLVATSILKQRPNDWAAASWALHDREDTVRKHYAHLRSDDAHRWFEAAMAGPFGRM
jgi:hypothetical protein